MKTLNLANLADTLTTLAALSLFGYVEGNPALAAMIGTVGLYPALAFKLALVSGVAYLFRNRVPLRFPALLLVGAALANLAGMAVGLMEAGYG